MKQKVTSALQYNKTEKSLKVVWNARVWCQVVAVLRVDCSIVSVPQLRSSCLPDECWFTELWERWHRQSEDGDVWSPLWAGSHLRGTMGVLLRNDLKTWKYIFAYIVLCFTASNHSFLICRHVYKTPTTSLSLQVIDCSFQCASSTLWNQLPDSQCQPQPLFNIAHPHFNGCFQSKTR